MRVLVVSEEPLERRRAVSALSLRSDVEVVEATSAADLRRLVLHEAEPFDVLVIDGDLQPRGGYEGVYDLRARAELSGVELPPAVILIEREQDRWLADWAGAAGVQFKPVDPFSLVDQIAGLTGLDASGAAPVGA